MYKTSAGRNLSGTITVRHKGGGSYKKAKLNVNNHLFNYRGLVKFTSIQKHYANNTLISLVKFSFGAYAYTLLPHGCFPGDFFLILYNNYKFLYKFKRGCVTILRYFPNHTLFFNFVLNFLKGSQYAKAAGVYCLMIELNSFKKISFIQLPTKKTM